MSLILTFILNCLFTNEKSRLCHIYKYTEEEGSKLFQNTSNKPIYMLSYLRKSSPTVRNSCLIKWTCISMPAFLSSLAKTFGSIWHYSVCLICLNSYCLHLEELPLSFEMERNQLLQNTEIVWIFIHSWMWSKRTYNDDMGWILCLVNHHMIYIKEIIF